MRRNFCADLKESNVALVNEQYTADCMSYQFVVNPNQRQYHVEGRRQATPIKDPLVSVPLATLSLPAKPDVKPDEKPDANGYPCAKKPSGNEDDANLPIYRSAQNDQTGESNLSVPATDIEKGNEIVQDALDKAIEESKAVKDLVCS